MLAEGATLESLVENSFVRRAQIAARGWPARWARGYMEDEADDICRGTRRKASPRFDPATSTPGARSKAIVLQGRAAFAYALWVLFQEPS